MSEIFVNTARDQKQSDGADQEVDDRRRGMKLINGRGRQARTFRIAIANDVFTSHESRRMEGSLPKNAVASSDDSRETPADQTSTRGHRPDGVKALGLAFTVAATGLLLRYLLSDRKK